jgi:hypothetical protein
LRDGLIVIPQWLNRWHRVYMCVSGMNLSHGRIVCVLSPLFAPFWFAYISYTKGFSLWYFHMHTMYTIKFTLSHFLSSLLPLLKTDFSILFLYMHMKYFDHTHSTYPLPSPSPLCQIIPPKQELFYPPVMHY